MIDYEKLKLAHELAHKNRDYILTTSYNAGEDKISFQVFEDHKPLFYVEDIDWLVNTLKELTKSKHKYEIGQEVWYTCNDEIRSSKIEELEIDAYNKPMYTTDANYHLKEQHLYPTKESLIDAQIEYWIGLKHPNVPDYSICRMEEYQDHTEDNLEKVCKHTWIGGDAYKFCYHCKIVKSCDHEDDGNCYLTQPSKTKCIKCGEFY